jgi:PEP-CTERM motif
MTSQTAVTAIATLLFATSLHAATIAINPTADGSLYTCAGCNTVSDGAYVLTSGYIQGAVKFSTSQITSGFTGALLSLNPYGLPLWGPTVDVYGYGTAIGALNVTDANAGSFLGTLTLPANLGYGQDAYFDVTSFVSSINSPFVAFNLRSSGTNVFSSLEYNYGHPSQLLITPVPEPSSIVLISAGLLAVLRTRRRTNDRTLAKAAL